MCRLYKSPSDETINRGPPVYKHAKRLRTHVKDPVVHVSSADYGNTKITQHALKASVFTMLKTLYGRKRHSAIFCSRADSLCSCRM